MTPTGRVRYSVPAMQFIRQSREARRIVEEIKDAFVKAGATVVGDEILITNTDYSAIEDGILTSMKGNK